MEELELKGDKYSVRLELEKRSCKWVHSSEYYDSEEIEYWYQGLGMVTELETGKQTVFLVTTPYRDDLFRAVFSIEKFGGREPVLAEGRENIFADFLAEDALAQTAHSLSEGIMPRIHLGSYPLKFLVMTGIVLEHSGQSWIPELVSLTYLRSCDAKQN